MNLKVNIADIIIKLITENPRDKFEIEERYRKFINDKGNPSLNLTIHFRPPPHLNFSKKIFSTGEKGIWSLYSDAKHYIYQIKYKKVGIQRTAIINHNFSKGSIFIHPHFNSWRTRIFPLSRPLGELFMIRLLAKRRGIDVHSCGTVDKRKGLIFIGSSGAGKSTIAKLWERRKDRIILSDDRIIIRKLNNRLFIFGTPWYGDATFYANFRAPLSKIFFLKQSQEDKIVKLDVFEAIQKMIICSFPSFFDSTDMEYTLSLITEICNNIPCFELNFLPHQNIINTIRAHQN